MMDEEEDMREETAMQDAADDWEHFGFPLKTKSRRRPIIIGGIVLAVILVVAISVSSGSKKQEPLPPVYATVEEEKKELFSLIKDTLTSLDLPTNDLLLTTSYQFKAFDWLSENSNIETYEDSHRLQRFALACFYYSTYQVETKYTPQPDPWVYEEYWLTDKHECDWTGVHCTASKRIHSISLERNNLSGKLPLELALLSDTLKGLDLSTNALAMNTQDMQVFGLLPRLEKLLLDDNYLVSANGLPKSLKTCTDLRKLRLSYNLMDGTLDNGVLNGLQKLTHLEIESNFFTGALPFLGNMSELRHVYLRRNNFHAHLNFLKKSESHNIQELWLDGNPISGPIPSQIGKMSVLESLSIAGAQLTGTLPAEMGHLSSLRRVWLSNNQLSGTIPNELKKLSALELFKIEMNDLTGEIPEGVCSIVSSSEYEHKAIVADCDKLKCSCCTECGA